MLFCHKVGMLKILLSFALAFCFVSFDANSAQKPFGLVKKDEIDGIKRNFVTPRTLGSDARFKVFSYSPNTVYRLTVPYDTSTYLEFEGDETPSSFSFNNQRQTAWDVVPAQNRLYIRPVESDADSQMTVMTNKRVYFFELFAKEPESKDIFKDKDFAFYIKFYYPTSGDSDNIKRYATSVLPDLSKPEKYNFNYTLNGEDYLFPVKIFDDGRFVYFEFKEKGGVQPAIFSVDSAGFESIVNYRVVGPYVAVESMGPRYTLRYGSDIACVYNENLWLDEKVRTKEKKRLEWKN